MFLFLLFQVFCDRNATKDQIAASGQNFICELYNIKKEMPLEEARYYLYSRYIASSKLSSNFDLATLPPTKSAADQHAYRTYHQVQAWKGNNLSPTDWGWKAVGSSLTPTSTDLPAAPEHLLKLISCTCRSQCSNRCECKTSGLKCSAMCRTCQGTSCDNAFYEEIYFDIDDVV